MQIIEISEPGAHQEQEEIVVGIDFGTTNSLIAYSKNQKPEILTSKEGNGLIPSVIFYDKSEDKFLIGKNRGHSQSISSIKRLFAKSYDEIKSNGNLYKLLSDFTLTNSNLGPNSAPKVKIYDKEYSFQELAAQIFIHLKQIAENELKTTISKAVVSVPAYFDSASRGAVMLAAKLAGIEVLRLIAEPTAAAYAYGFHKNPEGTYMIYDLGGGTFDVSVLNMHQGILQVVAIGGDNLLGGDDVDQLIGQYLADKLDVSLTSNLVLKAKELKENMLGDSVLEDETKTKKSDLENKKTKKSVLENNLLKQKSQPDKKLLIWENKEIIVDESTLESLILPIIDKTIAIARNTLIDANTELDGIILVGGSSRLSVIRKNLSKTFSCPIFSDIDPDKAVAIGAALQAENLSSYSGNNSLLIDALPLSVGIELYGGLTEKIIMRNTPLPFSVTKNFTTHLDNQTGIQFHIIQGERELVKDCMSLAYFELNGIPPMKAGTAKIVVTFSIDTDGILSVTARENSSQSVQNIEIKPSYGLSDEEVNNILENSFQNAAEDHYLKLLSETKIDAENLINGINKAILETPDLISVENKKEIQLAIDSLKDSINDIGKLTSAYEISKTVRDEILVKIQKLNKLSTNFIESHLNKGAKLLLEGRHVDSLTALKDL